MLPLMLTIASRTSDEPNQHESDLVQLEHNFPGQHVTVGRSWKVVYNDGPQIPLLLTTFRLVFFQFTPTDMECDYM